MEPHRTVRRDHAWQDWAALHALIPDKQARTRFRLTPLGADPNQLAETKLRATAPSPAARS